MARTQKSKTARGAHKSCTNNAWAWYLGAIVFVVALFLLVASQIDTGNPSEQSSNTIQSQPSQTTEPEPIQPSEQSSSNTEEKQADTTEAQSVQVTEPTQNEPTTSTQAEPTQPSTPSPSTTACYHFESGRCWDDLEDEAYSAGIYDREYGYYGATLEYPDDCDAFCRDTIEDAYDEGWHDAF